MMMMMIIIIIMHSILIIRETSRTNHDSKCRMFDKAEHIKHIVVGCRTLAPSEYTNRHNKVAG